MNGVNINHDEETYKFLALTDQEKANLIIEELDRQENSANEYEEYGNGNDTINVSNKTKYIYVIWLNELSRKYAGNEILDIAIKEKESINHFLNIWEHQTKRWNFDPSTKPNINLNEKNYFVSSRTNDTDCEQTIGICKIKINSEWLNIRT